MGQIPNKVAERLSTALRRFQPVLQSARARDVTESDTSMIVTDMLADLFGFEKYSEITREYCIRGTFCDLAIKLDDKLEFLIEVKAAGLDLKDPHVKQAVDYAANQGVDWVILTNGTVWKVFKVIFGKPINQELVLEIDFSTLSPRSSAHLDVLFNLSREGIHKGALPAYHVQQQATNKFFLSAVVVSEPVIDTIRRELRRLSPDVRIKNDDIRAALMNEVLKREVVEGDKAEDARKRLQRAAGKPLRSAKTRSPQRTIDEPGAKGTDEPE